MGNALTAGATGEATVAVTADTTAERFGNKGAAVFATPLLVALMEQAAIAAIRPYLAAGEGSVGTRVEISHLAATPVGMTVRATAELVEVAGKKLTFAVEAFDDREKVGEGRHERYIIDNAKFLARVAAKK
jgi:fluoroacetyl-CoA thioesterase